MKKTMFLASRITAAAAALTLTLALAPRAAAQANLFLSLLGTNAPGEGTAFTFTLAADVTNLAVQVAGNTSSSYAQLFLKKGGDPTPTDYDWTSRISVSGSNNQICLEPTEFAAGEYGLLVYTPDASATNRFTATLSTNVPLRTAACPAIKPVTFTVSSPADTLTWHYYQVDVPTNLPSGWRIVLAAADPAMGLYIQRNQLPTTSSSIKPAPAHPFARTLTLFNDLNEATAGTYFIGVYHPSGCPAYTLTTEPVSIPALQWDDGATDAGTLIHTNLSATGGDYYFSVQTDDTSHLAWRVALNVSSGTARLYLRYGTATSLSALPSVTAYHFRSERDNASNGAVISQGTASGAQFQPSQTWHLLVVASPGAKWNLVSGEVYVQPLPALAADASSGGSGVIGAEGMRFFSTTVPAGTPAWRLWLNGSGKTLYLRQNAAAHPFSFGTSAAYTHNMRDTGRLLVVPPYLASGGQYIVCVTGDPGEIVNLDSRQQPVYDLPFGSVTNFPSSGSGFHTFRVNVPVEQIGWQVNATQSGGTSGVGLAIRQGNVPNAWMNDAFSMDATPAFVADASITLVPNELNNGAHFITLYTGPESKTLTLSNGSPVITDVPFTFCVTNDVPTRAGWRYYSVTDVPSQLFGFGWDLALADHVPGTRIAVRLSNLPGSWERRNDSTGYSTTVTTVNHQTDSSTSGFLQRFNQQSGSWYVGVYTPSVPLGKFILTGKPLDGPSVAFDGPGNAATVTGHPAGKFEFFKFEVPSGALGWDIRLEATAGSPGFVIRRGSLPDNINGWANAYYAAYTTWPIGAQWYAGYDAANATDWTGWRYDPNGADRIRQIMQMGMGNPLEPGTYYVGVTSRESGSPPMAYTLISRGIGTNGEAIAVSPLAFNNGVATVANLAPREVAYFYVDVPANMPSWRVSLTNEVGESLLMVQKDFLPGTAAAGDRVATSPGNGHKMQRTGDEHYLLMPAKNLTTLAAGRYYLAVASEGQNPGVPANRIGAGNVSFTLTSHGVMPPVDLGTLDASGAADLLCATNIPAGRLIAYQFTVPVGTHAFAATLENKSGATSRMVLKQDDRMVRPVNIGNDRYGNDGGQDFTWYNDTLINTINPEQGIYTLMVQTQTGTLHSGDYTLRIRAANPSSLAFDGGTTNIVNQLPYTWQFFKVVVPLGALGWDVRVNNPSGGEPRLVIRRDLLPANLNTANPTLSGDWSPNLSTTWPSGCQWATSALDWTGLGYDAPSGVGTRTYQIWTTGMGNPLESGTYYVGVYNNHASQPTSYTLVRRGIGTIASGMSIPVSPLAFDGGTANHPGLAPREVAYYSIEIPANTPSWQVSLTNAANETLLMVYKDTIPGILAGNGTASWVPVYNGGGRKMNRNGDDHYLLAPPSGQEFLTPGTYYLGVASKGVGFNPSYGGNTGHAPSAFTLTSHGVMPVPNVGQVDNSGNTDITTNVATRAGAIRAFHFSVPTDTSSLEVTLENRTGTFTMHLRPGVQLNGNSRADGRYGYDTDTASTWSHATQINVVNPAAGVYTLCIQSDSGNNVEDTSFTLRIRALGTPSVLFDGGTSTVSTHPPLSWRFFKIEVPEKINNEPVLGWDVRLTNSVVFADNIRMVVRRDLLPASTTDSGGMHLQSAWTSGNQWVAGADWTTCYSDNAGNGCLYRMLAMGMGNPLEPGTYFVGVYNSHTSQSYGYTLASRGIGKGMSIPVTPLAFTNGVASVTGLPPREAAYFSVEVPANMPSWRVEVNNDRGENCLMLGRNSLPNIGAANNVTPAVNPAYGGKKMIKTGDEHLLMLPQQGQTAIVAGTYYLAVAGMGENPTNVGNSGARIGTGTSDFILKSHGVEPVYDLGVITPVDATTNLVLRGGQNALVSFSIPSGTLAAEVVLENVTGAAQMTLLAGTVHPAPFYGPNSYGTTGGIWYWGNGWASSSRIVRPNSTGEFRLTIQAARDSLTYNDASFTLRVRQMPAPDLAFDPSLGNHTASDVLENGQSHFYKVEVPDTLNGQPVLGWKLKLTQNAGASRVRVNKGAAPTDANPTSPFRPSEAFYVPAYLTSGVWYVEVNSTAASTAYTLASSAAQLARPAWVMPAPGQSVTTPGLSPTGQTFGDSGIDATGDPLPTINQGSDLGAGCFDYYAVTIPPGNGGLLRVALTALSGTPALYLRAANLPSITHAVNGGSTSGYLAYMYDREMTGSGNLYANWVPLNGRFEKALPPGTWYLAVSAGNNSVSYRLTVGTGNVKTLDLNGGGDTGEQILASGDFLYYAVTIPTNAPVDWKFTYTLQQGGVQCHVRDTVLPGQGATLATYVDWNSANDQKNYKNGAAPYTYPTYAAVGTHTIPCPPLRPGHTYYLGFRATSDARLSVSCSAASATIGYTPLHFHSGALNSVPIPAGGVLKYRIDVPPGATRLRFDGTKSDATGVRLFLEQGTLPPLNTTANWSNVSGLNFTCNQLLTTPTLWPWQPGYSYFLVIENTTGDIQYVDLTCAGEGGEPALEPFFFTAIQPAAGVCRLWMRITPGQAYILETSVNLTDWFKDPNLTFTLDPVSGDYYYDFISLGPDPVRFFRLTVE